MMDTQKLSRTESRRAWRRKETKPWCTPHAPRAYLGHVTLMLTNKQDCVGGKRMFKDILKALNHFVRQRNRK